MVLCRLYKPLGLWASHTHATFVWCLSVQLLTQCPSCHRGDYREESCANLVALTRRHRRRCPVRGRAWSRLCSCCAPPPPGRGLAPGSKNIFTAIINQYQRNRTAACNRGPLPCMSRARQNHSISKHLRYRSTKLRY